LIMTYEYIILYIIILCRR